MNKFLRAGLAGILLINSAGCATTNTYTIPQRYEKPAVVLKEDKSILKNKIEEKIYDIKQEEYKIKAFVKEKSENTVKYEKVKCTKEVERVDTIDKYEPGIIENLVGLIFYFLFLGTTSMPESSETRHPGTERVIKERTFTDTGERAETVYDFQPKANTPVKFSSKNFRFDDNLEDIIINTDEKGYATATIIKGYPLLWRVTENEILNLLSKNLEDQIKDKSIRNIVTSSINIKEVSRPIGIETVKKGMIMQSSGGPYYSEVKNDKRTFNVKGYQPDLRNVYEHIQNLIKSELEEKFLAPSFIQVRDIESHFPVTNAIIKLKLKKTIPIEMLLKEEENMRKKYFYEGSEFFEGTRADVSSLLVNLEGQHSIQQEGLQLISNINSVYEFEIMHPQYRYFEGELSFDKNKKGLIIEMISLGSKIRTQEAPEKSGRVIEEK